MSWTVDESKLNLSYAAEMNKVKCWHVILLFAFVIVPTLLIQKCFGKVHKPATLRHWMTLQEYYTHTLKQWPFLMRHNQEISDACTPSETVCTFCYLVTQTSWIWPEKEITSLFQRQGGSEEHVACQRQVFGFCKREVVFQPESRRLTLLWGIWWAMAWEDFLNISNLELTHLHVRPFVCLVLWIWSCEHFGCVWAFTPTMTISVLSYCLCSKQVLL